MDAPKTHIHELMEQVARSPFLVAPEKMDELHRIREKHSVHFEVDDSNNTEFRFEAIFGRIYTSIRSFQHIWAAACYFATIYCERQKAMKEGKTEIQLTWNPDIEVIRILYEMSCQAFEKPEPMPWPPDINLVTPNVEYIQLADELFLLMCSFATLHEIGHFELAHTKVSEVRVGEPGPKDEYATEMEADKWAYDWILSTYKKYSENPQVFTKRTLGIIFALSMAEEFHYLSKKTSFSDHPRAVERLIQFYDDYKGPIESDEWSRGTCFSAVTLGLQMVAFNNKNPLPQGPYHGIRDFLDQTKAKLETPPTAD